MSSEENFEKSPDEINNSNEYEKDDPNDPLTRKEDYQIAICQDGKFTATFDTGKLRYGKQFI